MMDDYEVDYDENCPKCNHNPIHWRRCAVVGCDEGFIDLYQFDDPLFFDPGDLEMCHECNGTGIEKWCPGCGANLSGGIKAREQAEAEADTEEEMEQ